MIEFLSEYGLFLAKAVTIVVAILITAGGVIALTSRSHGRSKEQIDIKHLNKHYEDMALTLQSAILSKKELKQTLKEHKKQHKAEQKAETSQTRKIFVVNFHGDIRASALASLREEITAILTVATANDEVLMRLESGGGLVHAYGLAASQLLRVKQKKLSLTVAVDKIAASGGYMMACVADRIIAAPFAVLGSIGVVAQLPNFHRLLEKNDIDFEQFVAGEYKRTVTLFGENTDKARDKFRRDIEDTHQLFKDFVKQHRNSLDMVKIATGEHWYGSQALELQLVDELRTSDDYLLTASDDAELFEVAYTAKKPLLAKLLSSTAQLLERRTIMDTLPIPRV